MAKTKRMLSLFLVALMTVFTVLSYVPAKAATAPKLSVVTQPAAEYTPDQTISFTVNAHYAGKVMYRVILYNGTTKTTSNLWNTPKTGYYYTKWTPAGTMNFSIHWAAKQLQSGYYSMTVLAKRVGSKAKYDTYVDTKSFEVKPAVDLVGDATKAVEELEAAAKADLTVQANLDNAQAKFAAAKDAVAKVEDATTKAALQARIDAVDAAINYVNVTSVAATNVNTIKVTFDKAVGALTAKNFNIYEKANAYAVQYVEKVAVDKNVATLTMYNELDEDTNYVAEISGVTSLDGKLALKAAVTKELTYKPAVPASIAFASTTVTTGDPAGLVIKDANGNDITANYTSVVAAEDGATYEDGTVVVETSDSSVVSVADNAITTTGTGYSVVNAYIAGTDVKTGNTIIKVIAGAAPKLTSIGDVDFGKDPDDNSPITTLYISSADTKLNVETLDQNEDPIDTTLTARSSVPTVAIAYVQNGEVFVTPVTVGTTNITVVAEQKDGDNVIARLGKTITVTVKADPKATSIKLDKTSVKLVKGVDDITGSIKMTVLDQYGNKLSATTYDASKASCTVSQKDAYIVANADKTLDIVDGVVTIIPGSVKGTATLTFAYGTLKATATVSIVDPADFVGYAVVPDGTTLDAVNTSLYPNVTVQGNPSLSIKVYKKDANGNYLEDVTNDAIISASEGILNDSANPLLINDGKTGTEKVTVKVGSATIATLSIKVVDSTPTLTTVTQNKDSLSVTASTTSNLTAALFSTLTKAGAFTCKDQYGAIVNPTLGADGDCQVYSTDVSVVGNDLSVGAAGKVTLVVKFAGIDKVYMIDVYVK